MMFTLVLSSDGQYYVCRKTEVISSKRLTKGFCYVQHRHDSQMDIVSQTFAARIIAFNKSLEVLKAIKESLQDDKPKIILHDCLLKPVSTRCLENSGDKVIQELSNSEIQIINSEGHMYNATNENINDGVNAFETYPNDESDATTCDRCSDIDEENINNFIEPVHRVDGNGNNLNDITDNKLGHVNRNYEIQKNTETDEVNSHAADTELITSLNNLGDEELNLAGKSDASHFEFLLFSDLAGILGPLSPPPFLRLDNSRVSLPSLDENCAPDRSEEHTEETITDRHDQQYLSITDDDTGNNSDANDETYVDDTQTPDVSLTNTNRVDESYSPDGLDDEHLHALPKTSSKTKYNFCYYCKKMQSVISRHLATVHRDEAEVKKFVILPKGNPERRKIIETIRQHGNYLHNKHKEYNIHGQFIVARRPKEMRPATQYQVCHNCKGSFSIKTIRRHRHRCLGESSKWTRFNTILSRKITGRIHKKANAQLKNVVFCVMREDEIVRHIRYDELLITFANLMCSKYRKQQQHDLIRARLRLLGRLLRTVKLSNKEIEDFASLYQPKYYDDILAAIDIEASFNPTTGEHEIPSVVTTLGMYLKTVGEIFIVECIKKGDKEKKQLAEDFLKVHKASYSSKMNKTAVETQAKKNRLRQKPLPSMGDIEKLQNYLKVRWEEVFEDLKTQYSYETWLEFSKLTLVRIFVFNRRRTGEIERISIEDLRNREQLTAETNPEVYNTLNNEEISLVQKYARITICGKLGRTVPVLLSREIESGIELILKYRISAKVHDKNPYIFGIPGHDSGRFKHLKAYQLLRIYANHCGAEYPERLRGTQLRKHIATLCASENVDPNKIHDVANFMGHEKTIHQRHYVRTVASRDICGVGTYLERANCVTSRTITHDTNTNDRELSHSNANDEDDCCSTTEASDSSETSLHRKATSKLRRYKSKVGKSNVHKNLSRHNKRRWTEEEKSLAWSRFQLTVEKLKLPSTKDIREFLDKNKSVQRSVAQIRTWASNEIRKRK